MKISTCQCWPLVSVVGCVIALAACSPPQTDHRVSKDGFTAAGKSWPLTVPNGEVGCTANKIDRDGDALWFKAPDDKVYGLNSFASIQAGYADLAPIWLEDEKAKAELAAAFPGETLSSPPRISIGALSDRARETCYEIRP